MVDVSRRCNSFGTQTTSCPPPWLRKVSWLCNTTLIISMFFECAHTVTINSYLNPQTCTSSTSKALSPRCGSSRPPLTRCSVSGSLSTFRNGQSGKESDGQARVQNAPRCKGNDRGTLKGPTLRVPPQVKPLASRRQNAVAIAAGEVGAGATIQ